MREQLPDADAFFDALQTASPVSIRLNPAKLSAPDTPFFRDTVVSEVPWCRHAYYLDKRPVFTLDPCLHGGGYYVQEASSMFLDRILRQILPASPVRALDLCAAPGGKSTLLSAALPPDSLLVANEVIRSRAAILKENLIKWGADNIVITNSDPSEFAALPDSFDLILVDAPCSGEGMFRKDEKAVTEWSERNLLLCSERQQRILDNIWNSLKPGGYLVYSTCTYNPAENEEMLRHLLTRHDARSIAVEYPAEEAIVPTSHGYQFYPHRIQGEGFFIGVVQKQTGNTTSPTPKRSKRNTPRLPEELQRMLPPEGAWTCYVRDNIFGILPARHADFIEELEKHLHILYKGTELAEVNGRKIRLQPSLALYPYLNKEAVTCRKVDLPSALRYLKKEDITVDAPAGAWVLITYNSIGLGWGKSVGNRLNNYYPKEWRIRMNTD
ncbi:methyltransferase RsmF C-terminal domain-like protein [Odoribacter lunatus]|uniref:methyltransferase RsmF C-terminal domain-like protein n=1 Tax=Odoribacter lunatus TaxID=2941335 RepID=UPI002041E17D|nr:RNA methyltransferase [Odoribacter lunatus]